MRVEWRGGDERKKTVEGEGREEMDGKVFFFVCAGNFFLDELKTA